MKQFKLTFLLIVLMGMVGAKAFAHDIEVKNADGKTIYYTYTNNKTELAVSSSSSSYSNKYSGVVNIPESVTYKGTTYPVTSIGDGAFSSCKDLTSVTIPNSVTSIGSTAFYYCSGLTAVSIPNSVTSIGDQAFSGCIGLTSVTIPNSVTSIGDYTFYECKGLTSLTIGNSVTRIGDYAFYKCSSLVSITIPSSVTSIGQSAFYNCSGLTSVTIGNSVTSIGDNAFYGCSSLGSITIPSSVTSIGTDVFDGWKAIWLPSTPPSGYSGVRANIHYVPSDSYTSKMVYPYLTSMFEVDGIKYVPVTARTCEAIDCTYDPSVESIKIGSTVLYRGISMTVNSVNSYFCYANPYIKNVEVENNGSIGNYAFYGCKGLTSISIGNSVTYIGERAFERCTGLTSVTIPNSVTSIESYTFQDCGGLTSISIGNSVTYIGERAFYDCGGLTSVTIPNSVTSIGSQAFAYCNGLTSVTINSNAIASKNYTSSSSLEDIFGTKVGKYVLGDSVKSIGNYAFCNFTGLTSVTIPNSVTSIGSSVFSGCTGLTSVTIPNSVTSIGGRAFYGCTGLTSVTIGNSVTSIGSYAFWGCRGLTSVTIPNSVTNIGRSVFAGCTNITKLTSCATTPPICGTQALTDINKWDCTLIVPTGSLSAYQAADQWKDFFFIEESDVTAINRIYDDKVEGRIEGIYDLNGRKLERLQRGINIVKMSDGTTKKVVIK